jgi:hypothetical protein
LPNNIYIFTAKQQTTARLAKKKSKSKQDNRIIIVEHLEKYTV